jgi:hypothetical protein
MYSKVEQMINLLTGKLKNVKGYKIANYQIGKLTKLQVEKWQVDQMSNFPIGKLTKCPRLQNAKFT